MNMNSFLVFLSLTSVIFSVCLPRPECSLGEILGTLSMFSFENWVTESVLYIFYNSALEILSVSVIPRPSLHPFLSSC